MKKFQNEYIQYIYVIYIKYRFCFFSVKYIKLSIKKYEESVRTGCWTDKIG